jgi:hypothetical protein
MFRLAPVFFLFVYLLPAFTQATPQPTSDALALSLAQKSITVLTGGALVSDVTLNANVISVGSSNDTGTGTFQAKGIGESRVDLNLNSGTRSDVRTMTNGMPTGAWKRNSATVAPYAQHNCWTDAAWFFPALSSLTQTANPSFIFKYVGQEQHSGLNTQHIQVFQTGSPQIQSLSTIDFYLDPTTSLPLAVASDARADNDVNTRISNEIRFAQYQAVNGIQVPFHLQRVFNNSLILDVSVTSASISTGLSDTIFTLQ